MGAPCCKADREVGAGVAKDPDESVAAGLRGKALADFVEAAAAVGETPDPMEETAGGGSDPLTQELAAALEPDSEDVVAALNPPSAPPTVPELVAAMNPVGIEGGVDSAQVLQRIGDRSEFDLG